MGFARQQHGSVTAALIEFDTWTSRPTRFTELAPRWAQLACSVAIQYEPTQLIITAFEQAFDSGWQYPIAASYAEIVGDEFTKN